MTLKKGDIVINVSDGSRGLTIGKTYKVKKCYNWDGIRYVEFCDDGGAHRTRYADNYRINTWRKMMEKNEI